MDRRAGARRSTARSTRNGWLARIITPDADGDGYRAARGRTASTCHGPSSGVDPEDINPARAEVASNGADDDCDAATPDDGSGSVGSINISGLAARHRRRRLKPSSISWTHPQKNTGIEFRLTVDWGDG